VPPFETRSARQDRAARRDADATRAVRRGRRACRHGPACARTARPKRHRGITRAWYALKHSLNGFRVAIREESAFRQELTLAALMLPIGAFAPVPAASRALLIGSVLLVLIVELLNSSVEAAIDRISLERHELSKRAKDLGSAAVTVALFACVTTWGFVLGPVVARWLGF